MAGNHITGALFYLKLRSLQNLVLSRVRRLRQPKYVVGAVVGVAYLYFVFLRRFTTHRPSFPGAQFPGSPADSAATSLPLMVMLGASALLLFMALNWLWRRERASLNFSEAEIAFLFPAPVSRRALIHYRLASLGWAATFTALMLTLVSSRWPGMSPHAVMRIVGWWLVFSTLSLHTVGSGFAITRLMDRGISATSCQLLALVVLVLVAGVPALRLWQGMQADSYAGLASLDTGAVAWLLYPFKLMLAPVLAADWHAFALAIGPALLIYAAHYFWVLQTQVGFEEASIAKAEKRAAAVAAMRAGNWRLASGKQKARPAPFNLGRAGRPELAFLWKNLLSSAEYLRPRTALIAAAIIVGACLWFGNSPFFQQDLRPKLAIVVLVIAAYSMLFGPQLARQDFRSDLPNTDILKTYPLRGWQVMLGELLTPTAILTTLLWVLLLAEAMLLPHSASPHMAWLTPAIRTLATIGIALVIPLLCMSQLLIVNAAAVLFPAWFPGGGAQAQQGIEVMGQRIFFLAGQILAMVLMLLPAVIVAGIAFYLTRWVVGDTVAGAAAMVLAVLVLGAVIASGIALLGGRFERLDLSQELRP